MKFLPFESELMKNQKHAQVLPPDSKFLALQTKEGHSLFFSIGDDGVFYLTRETPKEVTGWTKKNDLSSGLSTSKVVAKTFDVSQDATGDIDLALIATIDGRDALYLSQNNSNSDQFWNDKIAWHEMPYDDPSHPQHTTPSLNITDVYLAQSGAGEYIVVDVLDDPRSTSKIGFRYYIDPAKNVTGKAWNPGSLPGDFEADKISSLLGRKADESVDGMYTFGEIAEKQSLNYVPLYNAFDPTIAPDAAELILPPLASAIAIAPTGDGTTNLFVAADKALYFFAADQQKDGSQGQKIVTNDIFAGVQNFYGDATGTEVFVWGLNQLGDIFYLKCPKGQETNSEAWSFPVPILQGVEQITPYVNRQSGHSVIFAHLQGDNLVQLTQDPHSAIWQQRSILLPPTDVNHVVEYKSFSTHVQVLNDDHLPLGKPVTLSITSKSPVGIYVNNIYHKLSADVATDIKTEITGALTIVQETQSLSAMCYHIVHKDSGTTLEVNPMNKLIDTISKVKNENDLGSITVSDEKGNTKKLVSPDTPPDQKKAIAFALNKFVAVSKTLPADGSQKPLPTAANAFRASQFAATPETVWGVSFAQDGWTFHEGDAAMSHFGFQVNAATNSMSMVNGSLSVNHIGNAIELAAEDFWNWLKSLWHKVEQFFVQLWDGVCHFFIQIGDALYRFVLRAIHAIVNAVEFIFNKIKTAFEDLIKWLGFIFSWSDILRTHRVVKNLFKQYAAYCIDNISVNKLKLQNSFSTLENDINNWAGLPPVTDTGSGLSASSKPAPGQHSPQSNWGVYHAHHNVVNANPPDNSTHLAGNDTLKKILKDLLGLIEREGETFKTAVDNLKDTIAKFSTLSLTEIIKKIVVIVVDVLLETAEHIVITVIDVFKDLVEGVLTAIDTPLNIPVISWLYKLITGGDELSFLDLVCLVVSIPATIIYKLVENETPFPNDATTDALINASDFAAIQRLCKAPSPQPRLTSGEAAAFHIAGSTIDIVAKTANYMAFFGSILLSLFNGLRITTNEFDPDPEVDKKLAGLAGIFYFPYASPSIIGSIQDLEDKNWCAIMDEVVADICCTKALVDISLAFKKEGQVEGFIPTWEIISPWANAGLNLVWQIPTMGALSFREYQNKNGYISAFAGTFFDMGGLLSPVLAAAQASKEIISILTVYGVISALDISYGTLMLATNSKN